MVDIYDFPNAEPEPKKDEPKPKTFVDIYDFPDSEPEAKPSPTIVKEEPEAIVVKEEPEVKRELTEGDNFDFDEADETDPFALADIEADKATADKLEATRVAKEQADTDAALLIEKEAAMTEEERSKMEKMKEAEEIMKQKIKEAEEQILAANEANSAPADDDFDNIDDFDDAGNPDDEFSGQPDDEFEADNDDEFENDDLDEDDSPKVYKVPSNEDPFSDRDYSEQMQNFKFEAKKKTSEGENFGEEDPFNFADRAGLEKAEDEANVSLGGVQVNDTSQDADGFDDDEDFDAASDAEGFERDEIIEQPKDKPIPPPKKQPTQDSNPDGFEDDADAFDSDEEMAEINRELIAISCEQDQLLINETLSSHLNKQQSLVKSEPDDLPNRLSLTEGVIDSGLCTSQTSFTEVELELKTQLLLDQVDPLYKSTFPSLWPALLDQLELSDREVFLTIQKGESLRQEGVCIVGISEQTATIIHISVRDQGNFCGALG